MSKENIVSNTMKFRIGGYYEGNRNPTPHPEDTIEAKNLDDARRIATERYGWGAWAFQIKPCDLCGWDKDTVALTPYRGRELCQQCYSGEINEPDIALPWRE